MEAHAGVFVARQHYLVYDGISTARARWLLPRKVEPREMMSNSVQVAQLTVRTSYG
jgi:hypothetical protein